MAKSKTAAAPAEVVALYEKLVATVPGLEAKGATMRYTSVNGNMSSYLDKEGRVAMRLPEDLRAKFMAKYDAPPMVAWGVVQKEYVEIPAAVLKKTGELKPYFTAGYAYVEGLRPKPTTKKKA